ncbi:hypothetical protein QZH41_009001 [Actinostola sp. cb2023]|nr:hypothetical protein QZH41_009001 [Actinostola sp. cb2023]
MLDYSLCNGLRDPPSDWFIKGNSQGKNQRYPEVDKSRDYLLTQLWDKAPVDITIPAASKGIYRMYCTIDMSCGPSVIKQTASHIKCDVGCKLLWDGYGRWINSKWVPFIRNVPAYRMPHTRQGTLHLYGDSVMDFFGMSLKYRKICRGAFNTCVASYIWVYPVINYTIAKLQTDDLDFNTERIFESVRGVLTSKAMDHQSIFIINCGLHYVESIHFTSYQKLIDGLIKVFHEKYLDPASSEMRRVYGGRIIWKTTTAINKQRATNINLGYKRFLTSQRVLLYNAYATWAMCRAGVQILDVYPMSDSYPWGTGTHGSRIPAPNDVVHYSNLAFSSAEDLLEMMFHP